jgi:hypothetical protein
MMILREGRGKRFLALEVGETILGKLKLPIIIINGVRDGPTLYLQAGVHGYEILGIGALHKVLTSISPKKLTGTIIATLVANPISAFAKSAIINRNLNTIFPGDRTIFMKRVAQKLLEIGKSADYAVDLHAASTYNPFVYCPLVKGVFKKALELSEAFSPKIIVIDEDMDNKTFDVQLSKQGVPAITVELGEIDRVKKKDLKRAVIGIKNILISLKMLDGKKIRFFDPIYVKNEQKVYADIPGLYIFKIKPPCVVKRGQIIAEVWQTNLKVHKVKAKESGIIIQTRFKSFLNEGEEIYITTTPLTKKELKKLLNFS